MTSARIVSDAFFFDFNHATCDGVKNTATRSVFFSFAAAIGTSECVLCTSQRRSRAKDAGVRPHIRFASATPRRARGWIVERASARDEVRTADFVAEPSATNAAALPAKTTSPAAASCRRGGRQ